MKTNFPITRRQQQVLDVIERLTNEKGVPPTVRELCVPFGININAIHYHLLALQRKGLVTWTPRQSRTLRIIPQPSRRGMPLLTLEELSA